ncbi:MAG: cyclic 2,3-diphosphoglycerate synthase [Planctomycetota bacterium]|jgi:predicted GTPase
MASNRKMKLIIMGAAGRDFHEFNVHWRNRPTVEVVCFTATQIPNIEGRVYPPALSGSQYPQGIPIYPESELERLIRDHGVDRVAFAYSDVSHEYVGHQAARVNAAGAEFCLLGADQIMIDSRKPVIAVCAVRTGCGKSQTTRRVAEILREAGRRVAVARHPMPYGDLTKQACQRFVTFEDMDKHECTIEEREEYELHIEAGNLLYAGVDYEKILESAEEEADVILWDGGNNDVPFFRPDLFIVVADPHRAGDELKYYPGETNLRMADLIIINKVATAKAPDVERVEANARQANPGATILRANSPVTVADPEAIKGRRVLVIEDGPTLTHGGMSYGAAYIAAQQYGAAEIIDPRPYAQGSIKSTFEKFTHLTDVLPAMGYGDEQVAELEATVNAVPCDTVVIGTPADIRRVVTIDKPSTRVAYNLDTHDKSVLPEAIGKALDGWKARVDGGRRGVSAPVE